MQFTSDIDETGQRTRSSQFAADPLMQSAQTAQQSFPQSALYIVGLPIGNAADITLRALWVLDICDHVACEDTRETRKLLDRYGISTPTISVHEHNERSASQKLIDYLAKGERIALVTDAGTPAVSDPGAKAVQSVREAGFRVVPVQVRLLRHSRQAAWIPTVLPSLDLCLLRGRLAERHFLS